MNETLPGYVEIYCAMFGCNDDKLVSVQVSDYKTDDTVLKFILGYNANNVTCIRKQCNLQLVLYEREFAYHFL